MKNSKKIQKMNKKMHTSHKNNNQITKKHKPTYNVLYHCVTYELNVHDTNAQAYAWAVNELDEEEKNNV